MLREVTRLIAVALDKVGWLRTCKVLPEIGGLYN